MSSEGAALEEKMNPKPVIGIDADMVDGKHASQLGSKYCRICEIDALPDDDAVGHTVLLTDDYHIYVCIEGSGVAPCGGCVFENVAVLPEIENIGDIVFLLTDKHVYIGV